MKFAMVIGSFLITVSLLLLLFITNKCIYLLLAGLIGLGMVIHMAIPYAIVPIVMPTEELGNSLGLLNCFGVIGQQISNFLIGTGVGKVVNNSSGKKIGYSAVFGFLATVASFWVIEPSIGESEKYSLIHDADTDFNYFSEVK
ncbi:hypothetical protein M9Y10_032468 [Tritrichomonas musculus]|uniref:Major facilitator superfamily (MFS) profile domain-containing protein n=1 Tax=Tritrichomonas musculus TaxID=1915356 RepID=A0ABR2GYH8_9EUKA